MLRSFRFIVELIAGIIGLTVVAGALLVWRLSMGPITSTFLTPHLQEFAEDLIPGATAEISNTLLTWDNADRSITLHADGIKLSGTEGESIVEVPSVDVRISVLGLSLGRLMPSALRVEHPQVWLLRTADGAFHFAGLPPAAATQAHGDIKGAFIRIADDAAHAYFMRKLQVSEAVINVHDEKGHSDWSIHAPSIVLDHHDGRLDGETKIEVTQEKRISPIDIHYAYDHAQDRHNLEIRLGGINPSLMPGADNGLVLNLPLTGTISLGLDGDLNPVSGSIDMHGGEGTLESADLWDAPRKVKSVDLQGAFDRAAEKLGLQKAFFDFGGPKLALSIKEAEGSVPGSSGIDFGLSVELTGLPMDEYAKVWPKPIIPNAREWIAANLSKGTFDRGEGSFTGHMEWDNPGEMEITEGKGKVAASSATVQYIDGMPPVEGVYASADFDLAHMTVNISGGGIGEIRLQPSVVQLTDLDKDVQNIDLPVKLGGPIPAILRLLDVPRLGYTSAVGLSPAAINGTLDGLLHMRLPLLKNIEMKTIDLTASATLKNLSSSVLINGFDISDGDMTLDLDKDGFLLKGQAQLDKVPLQVSWRRSFDTDKGPLRQASLSGNITGEQWAKLGVSALEKTKNAITASLTVFEKNKDTPLVLNGNLDMKAAEMDVEPLDWKKPAGAPAELKFTAEVPPKGDITIKSISLQGPDANVKGKATLAAADLGLAALDLNPMIIGRTNAVVHFSQASGDKGKLVFEVSGDSFDVAGLRGGKEPKKADPRPKEFRLKLNKLYTSDFGFFTNPEGRAVRDAQGWSEISFHGMADSGHKLDIELAAQGDHRVFSATCDDFGKALKGFGFTDTVKDGKLEVTGASTPENPRVINGKVKIGHFVVKDLPALAVLMNATSPFGIFDLFAGSIEFDSLEGKFKWQGDQLDFANIRASGNSVGMTIQGKVDMNNGQANLHGTMAPFSMVNRFLSAIPIIGDMLTGGEGGGVLAVAYSIKGQLGNPEVSVNPVSLLTPGFLRGLFFGGSDDDDAGEEPADKTKEKEPPPPAQAGANININKGQ